MRQSIFCAGLFLALAIATCNAVLQLELFAKDIANNNGAHCLDGTPSGYYFEPFNSTMPDSQNKWVIFLGSGGFCTIVDCPNRLKSDKGSSSFWPAQLLVGVETMVSPNPLRNLDMWGWNHVYVPYCTGDFWTGQVMQASEQTGGLFFSGHNNIKTVLRALIEKHGLGDATDIVFSGESSGGFGVFANADFLAQTVPKAHVVAVPQGGLFLQSMTYDQWSTTAGVAKSEKVSVAGQPTLRAPEFTCAANNRSYLFELYNSFVDESCAKAVPLGDVSLCMDPGFAYKYITTPLFVVEDLYDADQLFKVGLAPPPPAPVQPPFSANLNGYINYFGNCMLQTVQGLQKVNPSNGLFVPACLGHVIKNDYSLNTPVIGGKNMMQAFSQWMKNGYKDATFLESSVGQFNPTCPVPDDIPAVRSAAHNGFQNDDFAVMAAHSASQQPPPTSPAPVPTPTPTASPAPKPASKKPSKNSKKSPKQKRATWKSPSKGASNRGRSRKGRAASPK